jgi:hypothetical protein
MRKKGLGLSVEEVVKIQTLLDVADACLEDTEDTLIASSGSKTKESEEFAVALVEIREALEELAALAVIDE